MLFLQTKKSNARETSMKSFTLLAAVLLLASSVRADDLSGRLGVGGSVAAGVPVGAKWVTDRNDAGLGLGGWLAYGLNRRWTARLGYDNIGFSRGPARLEDLTFGAAYQLLPDSAWNPGVKLGAGPAWPRSVASGRPTTLGLTAGLGVDRFLTPCFSVGAALDWLMSGRAGGATHDVHALRAGLTAGLWFGGKKEAPKQAKAAPSPAPAPAPAPAAAVTVALSPAEATLGQGASQTFTPTVTGSDQGVTWTLEPALGSISATGAYTAPAVVAAAQNVSVTATSRTDASKKASSIVHLTAPEKVEIALNVQFDTAKDVVKPQYDGELKRVAQFLKDYPSAKAEIEGHTDNAGSADYNRALSQRRADAVRKALVDRFGADAARLSAKGYGPDRPIADNKTAEGRAANRRVVATFTAAK
jgi:OOP family OmpA-OmpF porin